ncbi:hypothetical protein D1AOALGA4SA_1087 [Olavius algarvensis Delta 1 endosymbiont]|nr:hypothetical protein D1AOALGA4SA_1087 [Olavius algarvensis Delta 1 endosymbiont]
MKSVWVIGTWNLMIICYLNFVIWNFLFYESIKVELSSPFL